MTLASGTRLGPYEIVSPLGAGGMGEVFRARDTRLDRSVAIKVLPREFADNAQLKLRFEREAKTISHLEHPNICRLYDVGEGHAGEAAGGPLSYLVMELLEGETLADRLLRGPLPLPDVLKFGAQIADALASAHRAGVVHRDVKPANIMLTKSGAKLLDFGLAKLGGAPAAWPASLAGPTEQKPLTEEGTIVGTFHYMAPEQLEGEDADPRSDIWGLGCVLYEMTTGRRAFQGTSRTSLIAAIVSVHPEPVSSMQPLSPPALDHVIQKCLSKDADDRWQSVHDVAEELRWIAEKGSQAGVVGPLALKRKSRERLLAATAVIAIIVAAVASYGWFRARERGSETFRLTIPFPPQSRLAGIGLPNVALSPDGSRIVYSARGHDALLYSRPINSFQATPLKGTENGEGPFFSPDGEWIGYFIRGGMRKVRVSGGAPLTIVSTGGTPRGAAWGADGFIYYTPDTASGIWRVSAEGGKPEPMTILAPQSGENSHRWPQLLPDGKRILFTIRTDRIASFDEAKIAVLSLESKQWRVVLEGASHAQYIATGDLLFAQRGSLFAVPFDLDSLAVTGSPRLVIEGVLRSEASGAAQYAIAQRAGTLAFVPSIGELPGSTLVAVDRAGKELRSMLVTRRFEIFRVSPDQRRLAVQVAAANDDIWTYDLDRGTLTRLSFEPGDEGFPAWTADGSSVIFGGEKGLYSQSVDGAGGARLLVAGRIARHAACSPDGQSVLYGVIGDTTGPDLWRLSLKDGRASPFVQTPYPELEPVFSPDGRWLVYMSHASGRGEVYLRRSEGGGQWQISSEGGFEPRWSRDGREIFYRRAATLYAVPVNLAAEPLIEKPRLLFSFPGLASYDVYGDGFLITRVSDRLAEATLVNVVVGWLDEFRRTRN